MLYDSRPQSNRVHADLHSNLLGSRFGRHRATVCLCGTHSCIFSSLESVIYIYMIYISAKRHACSFSFGGHDDSETCRRLLLFIPGHVSPIPKHAERPLCHMSPTEPPQVRILSYYGLSHTTIQPKSC